MSIKALQQVKDAMTKHVIVISDGDPTPPTRAVINQLATNKITVTAVLCAAHGNDPGAISMMRDLATKTKGRFYNVTNPKSLPRIYQKEARIISRPLIFEQANPWTPVLRYSTEPVSRIPAALPPITGFVQTSLKDSELVETPIVSPVPQSGEVNPILSHWNYGLGRSVAFTSDAGRRWATAWPSWDSYAAFWSQVVRWSMRPVDNRNLALTVRREEGKLKIVVDALDKDNQFLNFLQMQASVLGPDLQPIRVGLQQTAPGRYEGVAEKAEASGNYFVNLGYSGPDGSKGIVTSGISVPYSDEYRELRSNPTTLETIASLTNGQVHSWKTRGAGEIDIARTAAEMDAFRRDAYTLPPRGFSPLWPNLLWLAAVLFLGDVAVRRVAPDVDRLRQSIRAAYWRLRGETVLEPVEYIEKLKGRKAEVAEQIDRSRLSATRFEAPTLPEGTVVDEPLLGGAESPTRRDRRGPIRRPSPRPRSSHRRAIAIRTGCSRRSRRSGRSGRRTRANDRAIARRGHEPIYGRGPDGRGGARRGRPCRGARGLTADAGPRLGRDPHGAGPRTPRRGRRRRTAAGLERIRTVRLGLLPLRRGALAVHDELLPTADGADGPASGGQPSAP